MKSEKGLPAWEVVVVESRIARQPWIFFVEFLVNVLVAAPHLPTLYCQGRLLPGLVVSLEVNVLAGQEGQEDIRDALPASSYVFNAK